MPNWNQQGGSRSGRNDQNFEQRNQRSQRPQQAYRGEPQQDQRTAGGRSEAYARQRDGEQMRAGYGSEEWQHEHTVHNVRSEPHWDPSSARGTWDPAGSHAGTHGNWEDDRYYGSPSYGSDDSSRTRDYRSEGSIGNRGREWLEESRYRGPGQAQGFGSRESYNRNVGGYGASDFRGERGFDSDRNYGERGASGFGVYGSRHDIRSERGYQSPDYERSGQHDESLGQQLSDAGRRLVGKVKRIVRNPKNYTRSDERIREDVCDRLSMSAEVDPSEIEVTVSNGEVTLAGTVMNRQMKFQAEELADDVSGVHDVHNQLRVRRDQSTQSSSQGSQSDLQRNRNIGRS